MSDAVEFCASCDNHFPEGQVCSNCRSQADAPASLAAALVALQADLPHITKDATATVPGKDGKRGYSYSYANLATVSQIILPRLAAVGLCFIARPTIRASGGPVLLYSLMHENGDELSGEYPLPSSPSSPQAFG